MPNVECGMLNAERQSALTSPFSVQSPELPYQLLPPFVDDLRQDDPDFDQQIAAAARRRRAPAVQPEALAGLSAGRNPELDRTFERRHLDACTENRFMHAHREHHGEIVPL